MNNFLALIAVSGIAATSFAQSNAGMPASCLRVRTSFDLVVNAPYAVAAPLFGPEGERGWAGKDWDPQFIYPQPARDAEGAVFTVRHGALSAVWVNTLFDVEARHFQYVYFLPELMVTVIDVRFKPTGDSTKVNVVYTRTALTAEGNEHVRAKSESDKAAGKEWQEAINKYLAAGKHSD
jgi:hypothetical protein